MREEQNRRQQFTQGRVNTKLPLTGGQQSSLLLEEQDNRSNTVSLNIEPMGQMVMQQAMRDDTVCFYFIIYKNSITLKLADVS